MSKFKLSEVASFEACQNFKAIREVQEPAMSATHIRDG